MSDREDRIQELRIENRRLKQQVEDFEKRVLSLVGNTVLEASGEGANKNLIINKLLEFFSTTQDQLNIVSPKVDNYFKIELQKVAKRGVPVLLITNDRRLLSKPNQKIFDELKKTQGMSIITNPNVRFLLVFNTEEALYSGGSLNKEDLDHSIIIVTILKELSKIRKIAEIFSMMLPSFMRQ